MPSIAFSPLALVGTIVGGLVVAGLLGWVRRQQLVILVPRLFSHSQITDRGQLVEVTIFNRGFKTEEAVEVTMNHVLRYELIGSNDQDVTVKDNKIFAQRIGPSDDVTVILLVEPGTFKQDDIVRCLSKDTKGTIVSKLEQVPPTGPQRIRIIGFLVAVPALLYGASLLIDYAVGVLNPETKVAIERAKQRESIEIQGWKIPWYEADRSRLFADLKDGAISVLVGASSQNGDVASIPVSVINHTKNVIKFSVEMNSAGSSKRFHSFELATYGIVVTPGSIEQRSISVVIPKSSRNPAERTAFIDVNLSDLDGNLLSLHTQVEIQ